MSEFKTGNVVMLAQGLNVSLLRESWLVENGVVVTDDKIENLVIAPIAVSFRTQSYEFLALHERVQVSTLNEPVPGEPTRYCEVAKKLASALPSGTFKAIGLNFEFCIALAGLADLAQRIRNIMLPSTFPLADEFSAPDVRAGIYLSRQFGEGRLRLDTKPVIDLENRESLNVSANFNLNASEQALIENWINKSNEAFSFAKTLTDKLEGSLRMSNTGIIHAEH